MSEQGFEIKNLDILLQPYISKNLKIVEVKMRPLMASAGENYGSQMLNVEIKLHDENSNKGTSLNVVAKLCPPNEWLRKVFNIQVTFTKEIAMYTTVISTLQHFQRKQGVFDVIDCFPQCYGGRTNLNSSDVVDDDAVLLMENLTNSGYVLVDRMEGFDLESAQLILKDLAVLHAIPIAIKILEPNLFAEKLLPYLEKVKVFDTVSEDVGASMMNGMVETAKLNHDCIELVPRILEGLQKSANSIKERQPIREPFATLTHNDLWVNNTMLKYENERPVKNKIIDFQFIEYGSPANDVVFFLFSSVKKEILDVHYENLVQFYYKTFIDTLKSLKCDSSLFTYPLFLEEIDYAAKNIQFFHVMLMLRPIYSIKEKVTELSKMTEKDMLDQGVTSDKYLQKVPEMVLEFAKRNWI